MHYEESKVQNGKICGLILCLSCQSNFGLNTQGSECPLHDKSDPGNVLIDAYNMHVSNCTY